MSHGPLCFHCNQTLLSLFAEGNETTCFLLSSLIHYSSSCLIGYKWPKCMPCSRDQISISAGYKGNIFKDTFSWSNTSLLSSPEVHFPCLTIIETKSVNIQCERLGSKLQLHLHQEVIRDPLHTPWPSNLSSLMGPAISPATGIFRLWVMVQRDSFLSGRCFPSSWYQSGVTCSLTANPHRLGLS